MVLIEAKHLVFSYPPPSRNGKSKAIFHDLTFSMAPGEKIGLIGCNGVGKSTLLKLLVGLLPVNPEMLSVCNRPLEVKNYPFIRTQVGYAFQDADSQLFLPTVQEDVGLGLQQSGLPLETIQQRVLAVLTQLHLATQKDTMVYRLSGGQKRLAALAGLLVMDPQLLLLDEPSNALDPKNRRNLIQILRKLPCGEIIASHDLDFIMDTCERIILLHKGAIRADGPARQILRDKALLETCNLELPLRLQGMN